MGQATSKRRSYTPGHSEKAADSSAAKSFRPNGDTKSSGLTNGSIEVRSSGGHDSDQIEADDTTSPTSPTSDTSTGRKENKRKRFRVSGLFSLKRTPSGKWPRRRKTTSSSSVNGTRPVSCPVPQSEAAGVASPGRPQSLFLEELDINEDDGKIETVDLSDHEQDGKSKQKTGKATGEDAPKAPPKIKGRRGSKKQSSLKKKKQEKKNSKKDKKNKSKQKGATTSGSEAESPSPVETKSETAGKLETEGTAEAVEELIPCLTSAEEREGSSSSALGLTQQVLAQIDAKSKEEKVEGDVEEVKVARNTEEDLDAVASSIVAETMDIAQKRLGEETICRSDGAVEVDENISFNKGKETVTTIVEKSVEESGSEHIEVVAEDVIVSSTDIQVESIPLVVEAEINPSKVTTQETTPSPQAPPRRKHSLTQTTNAELPGAPSAVETNIQENTSLPHSKDITPNIETGEISNRTETNESSTESTGVEASGIVKEEMIEKVEEQIQQLMPKVSADSQVLAAVSLADKNSEDEAPQASLEEEKVKESSNISPQTELFNEAPVDVGEEIAAVSASVAAIESEMVQNGTEEEKETEKVKVKTASVSSDSDKQTKADILKEKNEKKRLERERLKKEKEAERAKEKERLKEEKRKKAEQKSAEKEKSKSQKKIKVPKRLSSLFQRKEKHLKQAAEEAAEDSPSNDQAASQQVTETVKASTSLPQTVETMVCPVTQVQMQEASGAKDSPVVNPSLIVDVSVEPLVVTTSPENGEMCLESQPANEDVSSSPPQSPLESPLSEEMKSPGSDTSEPASPGSDCDVNGSSSGSNVLKKISLGPRLRTAILRKKSSGASDSGAERTVSLTTPKSVAESSEMTPPPRKLRPRKPVEQYSPVTPGAHNLPASTAVADANGDVKLDGTNEQTNTLFDELHTNIDTAAENVTVEANTAVKNLTGGSVSWEDNDTINISTASHNKSPKTDIEPDSHSERGDVEDKRANSVVEEVPAIDKNAAVDIVLDSVTTAHKDSSLEQTVQNLHVSQIAPDSLKDKLPEVSMPSEPTLVVEEIVEASVKDTVCCEIISHQEKPKDVNNDTVDVKDNSDTDDTDPSQLRMPFIQHQEEQQQQSETDEDGDTFSNLQSPTVVSTASIVLRPSSVDDTCPEAETPLEEWIEPTVKKVQTKSSAVQTEYVKSAPPAGSYSLSSANQTVVSKTENDENSSSLQDKAKNLLAEVANGLVSSADHHAHLTEKDSGRSGKDDEISEVKDIPGVAKISEEEAVDGHPQNQVYTEVCMAQVRENAKEDAASDTPVQEETIVASSKPRATLTIAEYLIGTFEETPEGDTTVSPVEEKEVDDKTAESKSECPVSIPNLQDEAVTAADSFFADDAVPSSDVTLTEDTLGAPIGHITSNQSHDHSSEESEDSGQQTPTPQSQQQQQQTLDSVINGIVNEAVNGVLQGKCAGKSDESMESEKSPPCSPKADEGECEDDSKKMISVESNLVKDISPAVVDDNKNAMKVEDNEGITKDNGGMIENSIKPSPTETIEAYLKLQYQETGESISTPFVNGDKGFEENGNVLMTTPATTTEVTVAQDEQQVTG